MLITRLFTFSLFFTVFLWGALAFIIWLFLASLLSFTGFSADKLARNAGTVKVRATRYCNEWLKIDVSLTSLLPFSQAAFPLQYFSLGQVTLHVLLVGSTHFFFPVLEDSSQIVVVDLSAQSALELQGSSKSEWKEL